jgi:hypothetical protein
MTQALYAHMNNKTIKKIESVYEFTHTPAGAGAPA